MSKTRIPIDVRRALLIETAGRCAFPGCGMPLDRHLFTKEKTNLSEMGHIIGDSADGPRGDPTLSKQMAKDPENIIVLCASCHKLVDDNKGENYSIDQLRLFKNRHANFVKRVYDAGKATRTLPVYISGNFGHGNIAISEKEINKGILQNSNYHHYPDNMCVINLQNLTETETNANQFNEAKKIIKRKIEREITPKFEENEVEHLSLFGLASIPVLVYAGTAIGDRHDASTYMIYRSDGTTGFNRLSWLQNSAPDPLDFTISIPDNINQVAQQANGVAVVVSITSLIRQEDVNQALLQKMTSDPIPIVTITSSQLGTVVIDTAGRLQDFKKAWLTTVMKLKEQLGSEISIHIFAAVPTGVALEMGRALLPKTFNLTKLIIWDMIKGKYIEVGDLS